MSLLTALLAVLQVLFLAAVLPFVRLLADPDDVEPMPTSAVSGERLAEWMTTADLSSLAKGQPVDPQSALSDAGEER